VDGLASAHTAASKAKQRAEQIKQQQAEAAASKKRTVHPTGGTIYQHGNKSVRLAPDACAVLPFCVGRLTAPKSPKLSTAVRTKPAAVQLSSEELALKQIEEMKVQAEARRKGQAELYQKALQPVGQVLPSRSTKPLTQPEGFHLFTDNRSSVRRPSVAATPQPKASAKKLDASQRPVTAPHQVS